MKGNFGDIPTHHLGPNADTCAHTMKTYAPYILTSNPPQHSWVCPDCWMEGVEMKWSSYKNPPETYDDIIKRKRETVNG